MQINNIDDVRRITVPKDLKKLFWFTKALKIG
jgi:hypothetical protein